MARAGQPTDPRGRPRSLATLLRHQAGGLVAGAVDFGAMIACVEVLHASPVIATAIGATLGAVTNFTMSRAWIFRAPTGSAAGQAVRYALVSGASAGWNALGEHLVHDGAHVQYVLARVLVAIAVSVGWNFPLHRRFVFRDAGAHAGAAEEDATRARPR